MATSLLLNCDMGEQFGAWPCGQDEALIALVDQANLACGFHAGDFSTMAAGVARAKAHGVMIGAHPGYPDLQGFGRRAMAFTPREVTELMLYQIGALDAFCRAQGTEVAYVKPHGALYNAIADDDALLDAALTACARYRSGLALMTLARADHDADAVRQRAEIAGVPVLFEAFADRRYLPNGRLTSRQRPDAVLHDVNTMIAQATAIAAGEPFATADGGMLRLRADSLCVHGDTPEALAALTALRCALQEPV
ncbi:5-oxoprolinase subunit PxpA [Zymobacter palmae]|uniref:Uncharacterized proteins, homologs of lactam n=1 Tax=Zymobacter palmae TaxID=33074 RepID=A0A348HEU6_9GAMM|nr:5-oxoprolinase subunit PxpA [Zymobacter palmae]BBG30148.1 uncharacterized proteins, homologs of lactam [Zymobacter palmae]